MNTLFVLVFKLLPKNLLSRVTGWLVSRHLPEPLKRMSLKWFQGRYHIDMKEAEFHLYAYSSIADLFTRRLKSGIRPIGAEPVHPVDGFLTRAEKSLNGQLHQIKGMSYSMMDFLRRPVDAYLDATVMTYYLCPTDYHRVHSPISGQIRSITGIAGELWPVNNRSVSAVERLFARNERVVIDIETPQGTVLFVMVGATNVGQMSLSFDKTFRTNTGRVGSLRKHYDPPVAVKAGQELGIFHMGSTVIVVWPKTFAVKVEGLNKILGPTKMGQSIRHYFQ